jgi:hypothetical protein
MASVRGVDAMTNDTTRQACVCGVVVFDAERCGQHFKQMFITVILGSMQWVDENLIEPHGVGVPFLLEVRAAHTQKRLGPSAWEEKKEMVAQEASIAEI